MRTTDRQPSSVMLAWLRQDLAATSQTWIIAFWHHPPYSKGSHDSDNPITDPELVQMRQNVLWILDEGGTDLVVTGHSHSYERSYLLNGQRSCRHPLGRAGISFAGHQQFDQDQSRDAWRAVGSGLIVRTHYRAVGTVVG